MMSRINWILLSVSIFVVSSVTLAQHRIPLRYPYGLNTKMDTLSVLSVAKRRGWEQVSRSIPADSVVTVTFTGDSLQFANAEAGLLTTDFYQGRLYKLHIMLFGSRGASAQDSLLREIVTFIADTYSCRTLTNKIENVNSQINPLADALYEAQNDSIKIQISSLFLQNSFITHIGYTDIRKSNDWTKGQGTKKDALKKKARRDM